MAPGHYSVSASILDASGGTYTLTVFASRPLGVDSMRRLLRPQQYCIAPQWHCQHADGTWTMSDETAVGCSHAVRMQNPQYCFVAPPSTVPRTLVVVLEQRGVADSDVEPVAIGFSVTAMRSREMPLHSYNSDAAVKQGCTKRYWASAEVTLDARALYVSSLL